MNENNDVNKTTVKTYPDSEAELHSVAEPAAAYALPSSPAAQQAAMEAIMLMFSTLDEQSKRTISRRIKLSTFPSDEEADRLLADELRGLPAWDEVEHGESMDSLSREDYLNALKANRRKPMKGIEKWL